MECYRYRSVSAHISLFNPAHIFSGGVVARCFSALRLYRSLSFGSQPYRSATLCLLLSTRRIGRSHTPRDLGTTLTLDDSNVVLALQIKPELGAISKIWSSLTAVFAVIDRRPFSMSVIRADGALRSSASRFALSSRVAGVASGAIASC